MVVRSTTGWVDPARVATTRQQLLNALARLDTARNQLTGSSVGLASRLRNTITEDLIPALTQILDFDGWHHWETAAIVPFQSPLATTFRFSSDHAELRMFAGYIARGGIADKVVTAFATHLAQTGTGLSFAADDLQHPGSDWSLLVRRASATQTQPMTDVVAAVITNDRTHSLSQSLAELARTDQNVARLLERVIPQLGDEALRSILITLTSPEGTDRIPGVDPVASQIALNAALHNSASNPHIARVITDDPTRLAQIVTNPFLDPHAVESAGRAGMLITGSAPLLRDLVSLRHEQGDLTTGGVRLAATALIGDLGGIARTVDLPIVRAQTQEGNIDVGSQEQVAVLLADILEDIPSRTAVGIALGHLREERISLTIAALSSQPELDATSALASQLADINDLSRTFDQAAKTAHDAEMLHRSELFGGIDLTLSIAGRVAIAAAPAIGGTAALTLTGSRELVGVIKAVAEDETPPETITEVVNMATTVAVLRHASTDALLRHRLQLDRVTSEMWGEVAHIVEKFDAATTGVEKSRSYGDLVLLCSESTELTTLINEVQALSNNR